MPSKPHTIPEIKATMVSFDLMPRQNEGLVRMAQQDLARLKGVAKPRKALSTSNAYRVWRSDQQIKIEFLDTAQPEGRQVKLRFIYQLMPPFR